MTIGIVYCETLESEIQSVAASLARPPLLERMPWGLHVDPDRLLAEVREKIVALQDRVDVVVLGYGRCQAFDRLGGGFTVPVLRPAAEDCIGVLLGQARYEQELARVPGTWFLSPGWTRMGTDFVFRELQIQRIARKDIDPLDLARRMLEGFTRALYIDLGAQGGAEQLARMAGRIAADLGLKLERTEGSCALLREVFESAERISRRAAKRKR